MALKATKVKISPVIGQDDTLSATWSWSQTNTDHFEVRWNYAYNTYDGKQTWTYNTSTTEGDLRSSTFSIPSQAVRISVQVKPVSTTHKVKTGDREEEVNWWTADWSTLWDIKNTPNPECVWFKDNYLPLSATPSVPSITIDGYYLTAEVSGIPSDLAAVGVMFEIDEIRKRTSGNDVWRILYRYEYAWFAAGKASVRIPVELGKQYVVRARYFRESNDEEGPWSEWSDYQKTMPGVSSGFTVCRAESETSVYLEWTAVENADSYDIEYATKREYFNGSDSTSTISSIEGSRYTKTGLESGETYYFRIRAVNDVGHSDWSVISSTVIGTTPEPPTTWSSVTTAIVGEPLILYWVHNCEDGSKQTKAELEITLNGAAQVISISGESNDEDIHTSQYIVDTSNYREGAELKWRVRTSGVTATFGDWSIQRTVDVYAPPTLSLNLLNYVGETVDDLSSFPLYVSAIPGPKTQSPVSYSVSVIADETHEAVDNLGNDIVILKGTEIYSKQFDLSTELMLELSANNISLSNNISYTVCVQAAMNSGLTAEDSKHFRVGWIDELFEINAEIGVNMEDLTAHICPYAEIPQKYQLMDSSGEVILDSNGEPIYGYQEVIPLIFSVYRREYDGSFTEIMTGIDSRKKTYVTDPHPSLDYARYRIVAKTTTTGAVSFYDVPGYPIQEKAIIIQWDESWSDFNLLSDGEQMSAPSWSGSMLKLPWNIDISESRSPDVSLVEYYGRKSPVSYYGTQIGETATWNVDIIKADAETKYALRRLSTWMGDVYVREPSGVGYWAHVTVSFGQKHLDLLSNVTLNLIRVEGGV